MGLYPDIHKRIDAEDVGIQFESRSYLDENDFVQMDIMKGYKNISYGIWMSFRFRKKYVKELIAALQDIENNISDIKNN